MKETQPPLVSVLFVTWKRFDLLKPTVESFLRNTDYPNLELVIADDGSPAEVQAQIRTLPAHHFSLPEKHRGLGANNNAGLKLCTGKYILMIQDDWLCHGPSDWLSNAIAVFEANPDLGIINFAGAPHPPELSMPLHINAGVKEPCYVTPRPHDNNNNELFLYCDQPHIRSRSALEFMGYYKEDRDQDKCEVDYATRWKYQTRFRTAVFPAYYKTVFTDEGTPEQSHRLAKFRYRAMAFLEPARQFGKKHAPLFLFRFGRWTVKKAIKVVEATRLVR